MTKEKVPDRMGEEYAVGKYTWICGVGGAIIGSIVDLGDDSLGIRRTIFGVGSSLIGASVGQAIDYMRGYFNERLELEHQRNEILKQNKLEKNISQGK